MRGTEKTRQFGRNLQQLRKRAGYRSAKAFAERIGMNVSTYTEYEQGRTPFTLEQAWMFADELGCTLDELGGRTQHPASAKSSEHAKIISVCERLNDDGIKRLADDAEIIANSGMFDRD